MSSQRSKRIHTEDALRWRRERAEARERVVELEQGLRCIRDTTTGYAANVAARLVPEVDDPEEDESW